jgi:hypothetical protein
MGEISSFLGIGLGTHPARRVAKEEIFAWCCGNSVVEVFAGIE